MDDGLTESHRRVIGSGMLIVDSAAVRILDLLDERNSPAAIKAVEGSITEKEKGEIRARLLQLQELIASLVQKYDLEPSKKNLRRIRHRKSLRYGYVWRTVALLESGDTARCLRPPPTR